MCVCVHGLPVLASVGEVLPWLLQAVSAPLHSVRRDKRAAPVGEEERKGWDFRGEGWRGRVRGGRGEGVRGKGEGHGVEGRCFGRGRCGMGKLL